MNKFISNDEIVRKFVMWECDRIVNDLNTTIQEYITSRLDFAITKSAECRKAFLICAADLNEINTSLRDIEYRLSCMTKDEDYELINDVMKLLELIRKENADTWQLLRQLILDVTR